MNEVLFALWQLSSLTLGVAGKWRVTSLCQQRRRQGFALVVCSGALFNAMLLYSGLYVSCIGGAVLLAIDIRGFLHNGRQHDSTVDDYVGRPDHNDVGC